MNQYFENPKIAPSQSSENARRKIFSDVKDIYYFINAQSMADIGNEEKLKHFKQIVEDRVNIILANAHNLSSTDWLGEWKTNEMTKLTQKVKKRFDELQNPSDCDSAKKLVCDLNKACGLGCQIHHVMYCFITAYATNRVLVIESKDWRYNSKGYEAYFRPISTTCAPKYSKTIGWGGK